MTNAQHFRVGFLERPQSNELARSLKIGQSQHRALLVVMAERGHDVFGDALGNACNVDSDIEMWRYRHHRELIDMRDAEINLRQPLCHNRTLLGSDREVP